MGIQISCTNNLESITRKLAKAPKKVLNVGIIDNPSLATIGAYLEYGWTQNVTPRQKGWFGYNYNVHLKVGNTLSMPPRPFLRGTLEAEKDGWIQKLCARLAKTFSTEESLQFVGDEAVKDVMQTIRTGGTRTQAFPRRSYLTMHLNLSNAEKGNKKLQGNNTTESDIPLNKSGYLMNNIRYEIK